MEQFLTSNLMVIGPFAWQKKISPLPKKSLKNHVKEYHMIDANMKRSSYPSLLQ